MDHAGLSEGGMTSAGDQPSRYASPDTDLAFHHVRLATTDVGEAGVLVLRSDQLVAVLTEVDEELYCASGKWFLESGFGRLNGYNKMFQSLDEARDWIAARFLTKGTVLALPVLLGITGAAGLI